MRHQLVHTQYSLEMFGNRAIYQLMSWIAATTPPSPPWLMGLAKMPDVLNGYKWELYNIAEDYSEYNDLAAKMPDKLREMKELFMVEAAKYNVFPLDNTVVQRAIAPRPSAIAGKTVFTYSGEISGLDQAAAPDIIAKSYTITAEEVPQGGGEGMIVTMGGRFGGYGLYLLKGKPVFLYNLLGSSVSGGRVRRHSLKASTLLCSTLPTRDLAPVRAAPACCLLMASKWPTRRSLTPFRFS